MFKGLNEEQYSVMQPNFNHSMLLFILLTIKKMLSLDFKEEVKIRLNFNLKREQYFQPNYCYMNTCIVSEMFI